MKATLKVSPRSSTSIFRLFDEVKKIINKC